jgi:hypothetical protein
MRRIIWFLTLVSLYASALEIDVEEEVRNKEQQILSEITQKKLGKKELEETYQIVISLALRFKAYNHALYFVGKLIEKDTGNIKLYFRQMDIAYLYADKIIIKQAFEELEAVYRKTKWDRIIQSRFLKDKVLTGNKPSDEMLKGKELKVLFSESQWVRVVMDHDQKLFFEREEYAKIVAIYNPEGIKKMPLFEQITWDMARTLGKNIKKKEDLLCLSKWKLFPDARKDSYTMGICQVLINDLEKKKTAKKEIKRISGIIEKTAPFKTYLARTLEKNFIK